MLLQVPFFDMGQYFDEYCKIDDFSSATLSQLEISIPTIENYPESNIKATKFNV